MSGLVAFAAMTGSWLCWQLLLGCLLLAGSSGQDVWAEGEADRGIPEEELEEIARRQLASLRDMGEDQKQRFQDFALTWYNGEFPSLYKSMGPANVTVKKAIGSMMYINLFLEQTNCTNEDVRRYLASVDNFDYRKDQHPDLLYCGPLPTSMKQHLNCTFGVFQDGRTYIQAVVNHNCKPLVLFEFPEMSGRRF